MMFKLRPGAVTDKEFILSTWSKSLRFGNPNWEKVDEKLYFDYMQFRLTELLGQSHISVLCLEEDPDVIIGYSVWRIPLLHWIYLKKAWRGQKLSKQLIPEHLDTITHLTESGLSYAKHNHPEWIERMEIPREQDAPSPKL